MKGREKNVLSLLSLLTVSKLTTDTRHRAQALLLDLLYDLLPDDTPRLASYASESSDERFHELAHLHYTAADALPVDQLRPAFLLRFKEDLQFKPMPLAGCIECGERCAQAKGIGGPRVACGLLSSFCKDVQ